MHWQVFVMSSADNFHRMKLLDSGLLDTGTKTTFSHYNQILIITIFFSAHQNTKGLKNVFFLVLKVCVGVGVGVGVGGSDGGGGRRR